MTGALLVAPSAAPAVAGYTATPSKTLVSGGRSGAGTITTASVTVTPSGGSAPYTYAWSKESGDDFTINSPTAATTTFTTYLTNGQTKTAAYKCVVTDNAAATATAYVAVFGYSSTVGGGGGSGGDGTYWF